MSYQDELFKFRKMYAEGVAGPEFHKQAKLVKDMQDQGLDPPTGRMRVERAIESQKKLDQLRERLGK